MGGKAFSQHTHTQRINIYTHTNGAGLVSSVIRELAGGNEIHTHGVSLAQ